MKRWIRRILLGCSIALMMAAFGLMVRGAFVVDSYLSGWLAVSNNTFGVDVSDIGTLLVASGFREGFHSRVRNAEFDWYKLVPAVGSLGVGSNYKHIWVPHWISLIVGMVYPTVLWLRHRRRKKDVGFPVVGSKEPVVSKVEP